MKPSLLGIHCAVLHGEARRLGLVVGHRRADRDAVRTRQAVRGRIAVGRGAQAGEVGTGEVVVGLDVVPIVERLHLDRVELLAGRLQGVRLIGPGEAIKGPGLDREAPARSRLVRWRPCVGDRQVRRRIRRRVDSRGSVERDAGRCLTGRVEVELAGVGVRALAAIRVVRRLQGGRRAVKPWGEDDTAVRVRPAACCIAVRVKGRDRHVEWTTGSLRDLGSTP